MPSFSPRFAAPPTAAGGAGAKPAASGTRSPRKRRATANAGSHAAQGPLFALQPLAGPRRMAPRLPSGVAEFDRVTGGGFVRGSVLLLGGDPGIGKSTLLIQVAAVLARARQRVVYISGEEAVAQVRLRAERLGLAGAAVELTSETSVEDIVATLGEGRERRDLSSSIRSRPCGPTRRSRPRHRDTGARQRAVADPLRQAARARR